MKFYNREQELEILSNVKTLSKTSSKMTVVVGRRRIGKTKLILKSLDTHIYVYLFVAKKNEKLLCEEYIVEIQNKLKIKVFGKIKNFKDLFELLIETSKATPFTLVIDEFQEFNSINSSIYSEMQNIWDKHKDTTKMNLILSGSIYSIMKKIFENIKEPLFGRANERIHLKCFNTNVIKEILQDNFEIFTNKDLLSFFVFTGGVAKYIELLVDKKAYTLDKILSVIFCENSIFLDEGRNLLIEKFGKDYQTYFSILSLIASSKTSRTEIESILEKNIGGYLERLEKEYNIIKKNKPIFAKEGSRVQKYYIDDNFLNFWFRFIYKYRSTVEIGNYDYLTSIVKRDFSTFSGKFLEKYFVDQLALSGKYSQIGNYWEKGNKNEIDIIAINEVNKKLLIAEVKLNKNKINISKLKEKAKKIVGKYNSYKIEYKGLSLEDIS